MGEGVLMAECLRVQAEIEVPQPVNFLRMTDGQTIPVAAVTDGDLERIGELWTKALIERAKKQRAELAEGDHDAGL